MDPIDKRNVAIGFAVSSVAIIVAIVILAAFLAKTTVDNNDAQSALSTAQDALATAQYKKQNISCTPVV